MMQKGENFENFLNWKDDYLRECHNRDIFITQYERADDMAEYGVFFEEWLLDEDETLEAFEELFEQWIMFEVLKNAEIAAQKKIEKANKSLRGFFSEAS